LLRLKTLGGLALESDVRELAGAALQKRRLALLAALAVSGSRGLTREKVLGLLWTDVDETRGRQALSQALYALRKDTGEEDLVLGSDVLRLNPNVLTSDVAEFDAAVAQHRDDVAAALYDGPFLDGVYVSDSDDFDRWADLERVRLARAAERAIEELARQADARADYRAAADWWRRLVAIDPLKTRANLGLISALASSGERVNALHELAAYTERLRTELDAEPSDEVRALGERLRHEPREQQDRAIDNRFVIERELGRGGMAVVFLARDRKHDRPVALKMLHPEYGAAVGRERLEREILVTARLQHPHILPLHDSGEHGGTLYYVMPFVDGESLRGRMTREPQLALDDAVRVAREIADALDHAHRRGVVHCDIKPENVLLADGHAFVADFGIARLVSAALDSGITQQSVAVGTPAYMSPEQIAGSEDVGPVSDLFSLGCVLFEMLTGRPPWIASNVEALLVRRFVQPAPRLRALRPELPAWIDDVVKRLLVADPNARVASAAELVQLLGDAQHYAPHHAPRHAPSRLPAAPGNLIGRAREIGAASSLLTNGDVRLLTFTGAGGTGKTRLALQTASACEAHFEAAYFVDLSAATQPAEVEAAIADVLKVRSSAGSDLSTALASQIAAQKILLVLDNFEQVVSAAPGIARLLAACPRLAMLVTSRTRLGVRGEHEFFVAPLALSGDGTGAGDLSPAVQLFVDRAQEAQPGFGADSADSADSAALEAIGAICVRLDGLPLAIELAAARCRLMTPAAILARLEKGFALLAGGARDMPARHQTMRHAIEWSYGLLGPAQQDLFARMAVFAGGCTLSAVERVCADETLDVDAIAGTEALLDASLLMRDTSGRSDGEPRLRMLETVRELALERLWAAPGDLAARMFDRHRAWALSLATSFAGQLTGPTQRDALGALAAEHPNLLAAFTRIVAADDARAALAFAAAIWRYWLVRRNLAEGRELVERALSLEAPPEVESLRADAMLGAGQLAQNNGDIAGAAGYFTDVLAIRRRLGDTRGEARALADLGWLEWRRCDFPAARRLSEESLALARQIGDTTVAALALGNIGFVCHCEGNLGAASDAFRQAIALRERLADRRGVAFMRTAMAWTMCRGNQLADARAMLDGALVVQRELGDERLEAFALNVLVDVNLRAGDVAAARSILIRTLPSMRRIGDRWAIAHGLWLSSRADLLDGNLDDARRSAAESLELRRQIDDHFGEAESIVAHADGFRRAGRLDDAAALFREARDIRLAIGDRLGIEECDVALLGLEENRVTLHSGTQTKGSPCLRT
jgi:predicted ATPase/DNA-binding SARP family transcriptional activator